MRGALAAVTFCAALAGCTGGVSSIYDTGPWVQPGKYDFLKCRDITQYIAANAAQQKNLTALMAKADQDVAGPLINFSVYQAQLEQARADGRLLQRTALEKHCDTAPPPAPPAKNTPPSPAAKK